MLLPQSGWEALGLSIFSSTSDPLGKHLCSRKAGRRRSPPGDYWVYWASPGNLFQEGRVRAEEVSLMAPGETQRPRRGHQPWTMKAKRPGLQPSLCGPRDRDWRGTKGGGGPAPTSSSQPAVLTCSGAQDKRPISTSYHPTNLGLTSSSGQSQKWLCLGPRALGAGYRGALDFCSPHQKALP